MRCSSERLETGTFQRWVRLLWFLVLLMPWAGAAQAEGVTYDLSAYPKLAEAILRTDPPPIVYTEDRAPVYVLTRFVVEGTSETEWQEALEVLNTLRKNQPKKLAGWYEKFKAQGEANCPGTWEMLEQSDKRIIFERSTPECPPFPAQQALYGVLYGKKEAFTLIATRKGGMDEATREAWLKVLQSSAVR